MAKANFDHIYTAPDPRPYFRTLGALDYQIPEHGASVFGAIADQIAEVRDTDSTRIADLCCSYGINAAVMKHDTSYTDIVEYYTSEEHHDLAPDQLLDLDRSFFAEHRTGTAPEIIGVDISPTAINYGIEAGFLDDGAAENLERDDPSPDLNAMLESVDLVTVTGGIGYITERTIGRVLDAAPTTPWMAVLCLRWIDFEPVAEAATDRNLVVQRLDGVTFPQRRFADDHEREHVLKELDRLGVSAEGHESDGYHHAELYVLHPDDEPLSTPLRRLVDAPDVDLPLLGSVDALADALGHDTLEGAEPVR